ncbi:MAG: hypothetical protein IRY99_27660, partial [Isosphaeraceae bacterium]|nr:hypothetical protein [Isosphaeraceae bacterium]
MFPLLVLALIAQAAAEAARLSEEDANAAEARHLQNIRQVTFGFARAGEGYFRPDGKAIIFQATPHIPPSIFHTPSPFEDAFQIFTA